MSKREVYATELVRALSDYYRAVTEAKRAIGAVCDIVRDVPEARVAAFASLSALSDGQDVETILRAALKER